MKTPRIKESEVIAILTANGIALNKVSVLAIRGYYLNSMGKPGRNDRRIYDDAMIIYSPKGSMAYQANTDPNGYRKGSGKGSSKGMAMLKSGIHLFGTGLHKGRVAFRQCETFTVTRDGNPPYDHSGHHAIDLHSGGHNSTSSLGCQTVPASTWKEFRTLLYSLLDEYKNPKRKNDRGQNVRSFPYVLLNETERRVGNIVVSNRYLKK
tara:strand:- start:5234 stop:5857 length:624 start_codon:yes stop_codon:yes gene_type:complete